MRRLSTSFVRERELILVDAEVVGPASTADVRLVLDTGAAVTTLVPDVIKTIGYTERDGYMKAKVHTAVGEERGSIRSACRCARLPMRSFTLRAEPRHELERIHVVAAFDVGESIFDRLEQSCSLLGIDRVVDRQELDFRSLRQLRRLVEHESAVFDDRLQGLHRYESTGRGKTLPRRSQSGRIRPWTHHLTILSRAKHAAEREFYVLTAIKEHWTVRELDRQISTGALLRSGTKKKVSSAMAQIQPAALDELKDAYSLEFLSLPDAHSEDDLHSALLRNLGRFITELGRDFCFVGSEYPVQVGNQDFAIDLVFFHRGLTCLVAFELKVRKFEPADIGQLSFYVEALDRDVRKPHERPSIGVLLCAAKDDEVVEYALARTSSPTLVAEYQAVLPSKALLRKKLHELYAQLATDEADFRTAG